MPKHILIALKICLFALIFFPFCAFSQLFQESFNYPVDTKLAETAWHEHSGFGNNPILTNTGLKFGKEPVNGAARLNGGGQDISQSFESVKNRNVYFSLLVNVNKATEEGDYFFHAGPSDLGTNFKPRVWVKKSGEKLVFGISKSSNSPVYSSQEYDFNTTYQLIIKYQYFKSSDKDDLVKLLILEKPEEAEPEFNITANADEYDSPDLGSVGLRQGNPAKAPDLLLDEIRVGFDWISVSKLIPDYFVKVILPQNVYAFSGHCGQSGVFECSLTAFQALHELNVWSPGRGNLTFSTDKNLWLSTLQFKSESGHFFEKFYIKISPDPEFSFTGLETFVIDNEEIEEVARYNIEARLYTPKSDCSMAISDLKELLIGQDIQVSGRITGSAHEFGSFNYIQDSSGGIRLQGDFGFQMGDSVSFKGVLSELYQEKILVPDSTFLPDIFQKFDNKKVLPKEIKLSQLAEYQGFLIKLENLFLKEKSFVFMPNTNEQLDGKNQLRIWESTGIAGYQKPQGNFELNGIVGQFRNQYQIYPRKVSDFSEIGKLAPFKSLDNQSQTFDFLSWNIEWFGNPDFGPADEELQLKNVAKVLQESDADVMVLLEMSNLKHFDKLVKAMPGYEGQCSTAISQVGDEAGAQRVCFVYKKEIVKPVYSKALLSFTPPITNYPDSSNRFWAAGRFPFLLACDISLNGVTERFHLIGIHAKANRGNPEESKTAYEMRKMDIAILKDSLDTYFPMGNVIIAGDYNDDVDQTVSRGQTESTYANFARDTQNWKILTAGLSEKNYKSYIGYNDVIDHITISKNLNDEYMPGSAQLLVPFSLVKDYAETTSDHLPVMASFNLTNSNLDNAFLELNNTLNFKQGKQLNGMIHFSDKKKVLYFLYDQNGFQLFTDKRKNNEIPAQLARKLTKMEAGEYLMKVLIGKSVKTFKIVSQP